MKRNEVNKDELSPMMRQYFDIKSNYENELLFYRLGDFYELFFEDGETASRELELTLTGKNAGLKERIPMCGVPHHAVKTYIEKLVNKGYKVAICEQLEDPKTTKGMVKRGVVNVISKGTFVDLDFLDEKNFNYIASILDYKHSYLITYADVSTGDLYSLLINHNDEKLINEVLNLGLKEIISDGYLDVKLTNTFKNIYNIGISNSDDYLDDEYKNLYEGINDIKVINGIKHLLYYLRVKELKELSHFKNVVIKNPYESLEMDVHTVRNLELFETMRLKERQYSLIWLLDKCKTAMGSRCLKSWLASPLKDIKAINDRYDIIDKLRTEFILRDDLREYLYNVYDLDRLCGKLICGSINGRDLLQIKNSLKDLPKIIKIMENLGFEWTISDHKNIYDLLEQSIYEEPPITLKEGYLIKTGYNKELDELKNIRSGGKEFIASLETEEREKTGIKNLKVGFNKVFGYFIEVTNGQKGLIKDEWDWVRKQTLTGAERYITPLLKEKEAIVLNAEEKIINLEYDLFCEIKEHVKEYIYDIQNTSKVLSELDALASLAVVADEYSFVRPELIEERIIDLKDNRHPMVEVVSNSGYVANDIYMDEDTTTLLITGPNMSGKSTYMRQLAITVIMAQAGCFVPAKSAKICLFDKIFTRIGASDDLVSGESTFMVEMLEAKNAITGATKNSLILFDELGRGTATYDGMSLAESILEYVNLNIKCKTLFSTHYHELTSMDKKIKSIKNIHVKAEEHDGNVVFLHKIEEGSVDKSYGIHVASLAGMPDGVIKRAKEILNYYESNSNKNTNKPVNEQLLFVFDEKTKSEVEIMLDNINPLEITPIEAMNILYNLKEKNKK